MQKKNKKVIKKRKIKIVSVVILFIILVFLYFLIQFIISFPIQNIYIQNTNHLNDEYILATAELEDYPSYFLNLSWNIEKKLEKSPYIKTAKVKKSFWGVIHIDIEETEALFYKEYDKKYVLESKEEVDNLPYRDNPPRLINFIPDLIYQNFEEKFSKLNKEVRDKISEVKYDPSEYDDSRFLLYMIDGNYVYITITKLDSLNYYNEIYPTLGGKKGILYLDSGNHFQELK